MKKTSGNGNLLRSVTAMLIVVILVLTISIAVSGWQADANGENSGEDGNLTDNADNPNGDTDHSDGTADNNTQIPTVTIPKDPEYTYYLTGLECDAESTTTLPYAFVMESSAPLYGIANTEMLIEVPTENGKTRYIVYKSSIDSLGKIGAISKTRAYISAIAKSFGGILVANGDDDIVKYSAPSATLHLDLSLRSESLYMENGKNLYTDSKLIADFLQEEALDRDSYRKQSLPFSFAEFGEIVRGNSSAKKIVIPYSDSESSELIYDPSCGKYILSKGGRDKIDMLTGDAASFTNALILFADTITYELSEGTESVIDVDGGGYGYYATNGGLTEIRWSVDSSGNLLIKTLSSETLVINRGNTYVSYFKSSVADKVLFE